MHAAVVDIGSNTVRLVIFSVDEKTKQFTKVFNYKKMLQILHFIRNRQLTRSGQRALLATLAEYRAIMDAYGTQQRIVFATASLRYLKNRKDIIREIEKKTGLAVTLLAGEDEARLGYQAVAHVLPLAQNGISVDVGGGSTEIVRYQQGTILHAISLPIGSLSLYLKHVHGVFPTPSEMKRIRATVDKMLNPLDWLGQDHVEEMIGIGGSARAMAKVARTLLHAGKLERGEHLPIEYLHQVAAFDVMHDQKDARTTLESVVDRATTIIPGSIVLSAVAKRVDAQYFIRSGVGIREGMLLRSLYER